MKTLLYFFCIALPILSVSGQEVMEDEMLQARVHYMNAPKVSYIASAEVNPAQLAYVSNNEEVPEEIKSSFHAKYQQAKGVEWVLKEDRYKVNFSYQGQAMFAYLDRRGNWIKSFTKLSNQDLPEAIASYLNTNYPEYQLTKYYLKETPNGSTFTVAVKKDGAYVWLEFDLEGNIQNNQV